MSKSYVFKNVCKYLLTCLFFIVFLITTVILLKFLMVEFDHHQSESYLVENYAYDETLHYYYDYNEDLPFNESLQNSINLLPEHIRPIIDEWTILLSNHQPFVIDYAEAASGITYLDKKVIWFSHASDEKIILHEFGHVIDSYLGGISSTEEFKQLYQNNWQSYVESGQEIIDIHSISCSSEFFASVFADYILNPDYLKEQSEELYCFFDHVTSDSWKFNNCGRFVGIAKNISFILHSFIDNEQYPVANLDKQTIPNETPLVNINEYETINDYSWLNDMSRNIIDNMFDILKDSSKYEKDDYFGSEGYVFIYEYEMDPIWYNELYSYVSMYFLDENTDIFGIYVEDGKTTVIIKHDKLFLAEYKRQDSMRNVEYVLSTYIHEGSETEKLIQIADWIDRHTLYRNVNSTQHVFWHRKTGDCVSYAMIFKQFCDRLSIKSDIVYIQDASTNGRLYNRVILKDGTIRFYDIGEKIVNSDDIYQQGYYINLFLPISDGTRKHIVGINLYQSYD